MTDDVEVIRAKFTESLAASKDEDGIKLDMIGAGATFKNVTRFFTQFMIDAGEVMGKDDRDETLETILEGIDLSTEESFEACVQEVLEKVTGSTEKSAGTWIRAYGKKAEVEVYAKPKSIAGTRNPFITLFHEALIENPHYTEKNLKDLIASLTPEQQTNPNRWFTQHNKIRQVVNSVAKKVGIPA